MSSIIKMDKLIGVTEFKIHGMDCAEEVAVLKREIGPLVDGEDNLAFDVLRGKMSIMNSSAFATAEIMRAVNRTGMKAEIWSEENKSQVAEPRGVWTKHGRTVMTIISGLMTLAGFVYHAISGGGVGSALGSEGLGSSHAVPLTARAIYLTAIVAGSWYVQPKAWLSLRRLRPDMNLLMTIAVIGAVLIDEWLEAALVTFLFALSLALESWSVGRARRAVEALLDLTPPTVRVLVDGRELETPSEQVALGSIFLVKPGDRIPLDGQVLRGTSEVNQAPITGESVPVLKEQGAPVFAGTINGNGALEVRSTKVAGDTTLAHIIKMVGDAQSKRAPSEQWVEQFARYYTPIVFAAAILVGLIPPLLFGSAWSEWIYRSLVLLVIGCPCALVISTPVSIVAALAASARNGILIKGGVYVEVPARLKAIALDKTGTLTEGRPRVHQVLPEPGVGYRELLEIAAAMESQSDHPLARAIIDHCREKDIQRRAVTGFIAIQGKGATCSIDGKSYWLGSHRYLEERGEETPEIHGRLQQLSGSGQSVVVIGDERRVVGMITLADGVRQESKRIVADLKRAGIEHVVMLTGDNKATADAIAAATGVSEVYSELLPQDKVNCIEQLVAKYHHVAMVGDGVNDAPAMARASLGIAMGAMGSDAAVEAADIALMSDDLSKLPWLVRHSKRALRIIRQNISLSLGVKAVFVVLTFAGFASLWAAIAADMGVSLLVIFNALRLLHSRS
ncbi:MAG: heavy metal translocating P-type ATPase [Acidobacteriales bacterium]|nr:heavy metal translocating P-type ATPase [Terriglobales bacterium]